MICLNMIKYAIQIPLVGCMTCGDNKECRYNTNVLLGERVLITASVFANKQIPLHMLIITWCVLWFTYQIYLPL